MRAASAGSAPLACYLLNLRTSHAQFPSIDEGGPALLYSPALKPREVLLESQYADQSTTKIVGPGLNNLVNKHQPESFG